MDPAKALAQLAVQKQLLLAESEAQRIVLAAELHRVIAPLRWMDRLQSTARPVLTIGAPLAGFLVARRSKGLKRWVATGLGALRLTKTLRNFLRPSAKH